MVLVLSILGPCNSVVYDSFEVVWPSNWWFSSIYLPYFKLSEIKTVPSAIVKWFFFIDHNSLVVPLYSPTPASKRIMATTRDHLLVAAIFIGSFPITVILLLQLLQLQFVVIQPYLHTCGIDSASFKLINFLFPYFKSSTGMYSGSDARLVFPTTEGHP